MAGTFIDVSKPLQIVKIMLMIEISRNMLSGNLFWFFLNCRPLKPAEAKYRLLQSTVSAFD